MKRNLVFILLIGLLGVGLAACDQDDATTSNLSNPVAAETTEPTDTTIDVAPAEDVPGDDSVDFANANEPVDPGVRGPISILGNADFTAENGVVGGSGSKDDPYVIAGWEINVPSGEFFGVRIENVSAQFVLRGLVVQNATEMSGAGIRVGFADGGAIEGCSVSNSMHGVEIVSSTNISMEECLIYVSGRGLRVLGENEEQVRLDIAESNLYNDSPIYYFYGLDGDTISGYKTGHLTVAASRNVTIANNEILNGDGLQLAFVNDSVVTKNLAHRLANVVTDHGIHLYDSHNNEIVDNIVKNNRLAGLQLTLSTGNSVHNNFFWINDAGVRVLASDNNDFVNNDVYRNVTGITLLGGSSGNRVAENSIRDDAERMAQGVALETAFSNTIERNLLYGSEMGIALEPQAANNVVVDNTVVYGSYGFSVSGSNNSIERNLITQQTRGILFPETYQRTITQGNTFRGNVLADNGTSHVYTNLDSQANVFVENVFLNGGRDQVADQGTDNVWTVDGVGNYWRLPEVGDADGDGIGDEAVSVFPSGVEDTSPIAALDARTLGLGILGTLELGTVTIETEDGDRVTLDAFSAREIFERATGFRGFPSQLIDGFPGILFLFDEEIESTFTMVTVAVDLDIAFFAADGSWVGGTTMSAQDEAMYSSSMPFMYALELPSGTLEANNIGTGSILVLP